MQTPSGSASHRTRPTSSPLALTACLIALSAFSGVAKGAVLTGPALVKELKNGGYVLVMRHAQSPDARPTASEAKPDNPARERQLDMQGEASAKVLGQALRKLAVPIGQIYCSPTYRARETIRLAGLQRPQLVMALAEGSKGMRGAAEAAQVQWLRVAVTEPPAQGTNTLIVTHTPNIAGAFGTPTADIKAGEMIVFRPAPATAGGAVVGRITVAQWQKLAMGSGF